LSLEAKQQVAKSSNNLQEESAKGETTLQLDLYYVILLGV